MISLAQAGQAIKHAAEDTPSWVNWATIVGSAALSFLQPLAALIAVVWGGLQIYTWIVNKGWRRKR